MRAIQSVTVLLFYAAVSACSTTAFSTATGQVPTSPSPLPTHNQSTTVSKLKNLYEENSKLTIDPCHDSFINKMRTLGYVLNAEIILPEGRQYFGYWYATCLYRSGDFSALTESATAPIMAPGETLQPDRDSKGWSRLIEIEGRDSIVRPPAYGRGRTGSSSCMVSMTTSFGSMTITGGDLNAPDPETNCDRIIELLRQIEPWVND